VAFGPSDSLKIVLTTQEGKTAKRPNQAFLLLQDSTSNLDVSYPLSVKDSGKGKVELVRAAMLLQRTTLTDQLRHTRTSRHSSSGQSHLSPPASSSLPSATPTASTQRSFPSRYSSTRTHRSPLQRNLYDMGNSQKSSTSSEEIPRAPTSCWLPSSAQLPWPRCLFYLAW
jgi:hypothetical protein